MENCPRISARSSVLVSLFVSTLTAAKLDAAGEAPGPSNSTAEFAGLRAHGLRAAPTCLAGRSKRARREHRSRGERGR
jgi:hypothetical protein